MDGYNERLTVLVEKIVRDVLSFISPHFFERRKETYETELKNSFNQQPYIQISQFMSLLLREKRFSNEDLLESLKGLTVAQVHEYQKAFKGQMKVEGLVYGSVSLKVHIPLC